MMVYRLTFGILLMIWFILFLQSIEPKQEQRESKVAFLGILSALAIVLGLVESYLPDFFIPGVKIGLPNIVVLLLVCSNHKKEAFIVSLTRVIIVCLLKGNLFDMGGMMSLAGALLSFVVMDLMALMFKQASPILLSCLGALSHGLAQLLIGVLYLGSWAIFAYYPWMGLCSILAGVFSGTLVVILRKRLARFLS